MAWPVEEGDCATQEGDDCYRLLVGQDFGVGEAAVVVDGDVDVLVADCASHAAGFVGVGGVVVLSPAADAPACAALDPAELVDVDVDELGRPAALVTHGLLEPEQPQPPDAFTSQDPRHSRERHPEHFCDLGSRET
jgi:hypothetical protein